MSKGTINAAPVGRPSKYTPEVLKITRTYIDSCVDGHEEIVIGSQTIPGNGKKKKLKIVKTTEHKFRVRIPTLEGLANALHIHKETIQQWKKDHPDFSVLIGELLQLQGTRLIANGLSGDYNPTIVKVLLTKHGYREGHELANPDGTNVFRPTEKDKELADAALDALE